LKPWKLPPRSFSISATRESADSKKQTLVIRPRPARPTFIRATVEKEIEGLREHIAQGEQPSTEARKTARKLKRLVDPLIRTMNAIPPGSCFLIASHRKPLNDFREFLELMNRSIPSKHTDGVKRWCAVHAFRIVFMLSRKEPTGHVNGPMFTIASLLYEIATGIAGQDLKRSCDTCLRETRARIV
jgi:hypothetical protein